MYNGLQVRLQLFWPDLIKANFIDRIWKDVQISNIMKIWTVGVELFLVDRWTDRSPGGRKKTRLSWKSLFTISWNLLKDSELRREWHSMQTKPRSSYSQNSFRFTVHAEIKLSLNSFVRRFLSYSQMLDVISRRHTSNFTERSIYVPPKVSLVSCNGRAYVVTWSWELCWR